MKKASECFTTEQRQQVEQAVTEAEKGTACEIVPVVATASGRYDRPEDIVGLWFAILMMIAFWIFFPRHSGEVGDWSNSSSLAVELVTLVAAVAVAFIVGVIIGTRISWIRRLFTPPQADR